MCHKRIEMRQELKSTAGAHKEKATSLKVLTQKSGLEETKHNTRPHIPTRETKRQSKNYEGRKQTEMDTGKRKYPRSREEMK